MYAIVFLKTIGNFTTGIKPKEIFATDSNGNIMTWENLEDAKSWKRQIRVNSRIIILPYDVELDNVDTDFESNIELIYK